MLFALSLTLFIVAQGEAQTLFFADFEDNSPVAVPGQAANDPANWVPENAGMAWALDAFPGNGTQGLMQTVEGCGNSGNTPLMGVDNFTDGFMQMEMSWADNDEWGFIFRQSAPDKGYLVAFGASETAAVIVARLDDGCGAPGVCLDGPPVCENDPANTLAQVDHGLTIDEVGNGTAYFGRVEVIGNTIKVWYLPLADVADTNASDLGPPLVEIQDNSHVAGSVGVYQGSQGSCMIDNVLVAGVQGSTAVNAGGKLTTTWARIKN